jgi:AraC-like DNA-binding protein
MGTRHRSWSSTDLRVDLSCYLAGTAFPQHGHINAPSLRQIAADVGVHPTYLAASFQRHFGVSVGEFVRLRRIELAREMLANSNQPLSDLALHLGFSDQSHFCRTFKKQTSLSPMEYRRLFANNPNSVQKT